MTPREFWRIARTVTFGDTIFAALLFILAGFGDVALRAILGG